MKNKDLKRRIIEISYKKKLSHIGSCLTAVDIIKEIYDTKRKNEPFVLSAGHAGLALYVVLESKGGRNAEEIFDHHGVHPDCCRECGIDCSSGSLGHGLGIAVGMALADRTRNVHCLISDGECAEGSIWEDLRIITQYKLNNLKAYLNYNGYSAYQESHDNFLLNDYSGKDADGNWLKQSLLNWVVENRILQLKDQLPFLKGLDAHYYTMNESDYKQAMEILK